VAALALDADPEGNLALDTLGRLGELALDLGGDVGAAGAARASDADELDAEELREEDREVAEDERSGREAAAAQAGVPVAVLELACLRVREHLGRLGDLTEPLARVGCLRDVRVELAREAPEGDLDLLVAGRTRDAQQFVVVALGRRHQCPIR
jgi:hypothetical protein